MEVAAINHRSDIQMSIDEPLTPGLLRIVIHHHIGQRDVGDAGVEHLHEGCHGDYHRNQPWVEFRPPGFGRTREYRATATGIIWSGIRKAFSAFRHLSYSVGVLMLFALPGYEFSARRQYELRGERAIDHGLDLYGR